MILNQWQLKLTPKDTEESNALAVLWKNLNPVEIVIPVAPREIWLLLRRNAGSLTVVISVGLELQKEKELQVAHSATWWLEYILHIPLVIISCGSRII